MDSRYTSQLENPTPRVETFNWFAPSPPNSWVFFTLLCLCRIVYFFYLVYWHCRTRVFPPAGRFETSRREVCWGPGTNKSSLSVPDPLQISRRFALFRSNTFQWAKNARADPPMMSFAQPYNFSARNSVERDEFSFFFPPIAS